MPTVVTRAIRPQRTIVVLGVAVIYELVVAFFVSPSFFRFALDAAVIGVTITDYVNIAAYTARRMVADVLFSEVFVVPIVAIVIVVVIIVGAINTFGFGAAPTIDTVADAAFATAFAAIVVVARSAAIGRAPSMRGSRRERRHITYRNLGAATKAAVAIVITITTIDVTPAIDVFTIVASQRCRRCAT